MGVNASRHAGKGQVKRLYGQRRDHLCQEPWGQDLNLRARGYEHKATSQGCPPVPFVRGRPRRSGFMALVTPGVPLVPDTSRSEIWSESRTGVTTSPTP